MTDDFVGRREIDLRWEAHGRGHADERAAFLLSLQREADRETDHRAAHLAEHAGHAEKHLGEKHAVTTALDSVNRERTIHAEAHALEHEGHQREHGYGQLAIDKAEQATDKRFSAVNGTKEQMSELIRSLASKDTVDGMAADFARTREESRKELDRRFDEMRLAITNIEKGDSTDKGKELGRSTMVAIIVTAIGIVGTVIGILIAIFNVATGA